MRITLVTRLPRHRVGNVAHVLSRLLGALRNLLPRIPVDAVAARAPAIDRVARALIALRDAVRITVDVSAQPRARLAAASRREQYSKPGTDRHSGEEPGSERMIVVHRP